MSDADKDRIRRDADNDQKMAEGLGAIARMCFTFYSESMQAGFSPDKAFALTAVWLSAMMNKKMEGRDEQR